jgi:hypothetical protein
MRDFFDVLGRRRETLVARSALQRVQVTASYAQLRKEAATPFLVTAGAAITLLGSSPRLRGWLVRAWAAYSLVRRLLDR